MTITENGQLSQQPKTQEEQEREYLATPEASDDQVTLVARNQRILKLIDELDVAARQVVRLQDQLQRRELRIKFLEQDYQALREKYEPEGAAMTTPNPDTEPGVPTLPTPAATPTDTEPVEGPQPEVPNDNRSDG